MLWYWNWNGSFHYLYYAHVVLVVSPFIHNTIVQWRYQLFSPHSDNRIYKNVPTCLSCIHGKAYGIHNYQCLCECVCVVVLGVSLTEFCHIIFHTSFLTEWYLNEKVFLFVYLYVHQNYCGWTDLHKNPHNACSLKHIS